MDGADNNNNDKNANIKIENVVTERERGGRGGRRGEATHPRPRLRPKLSGRASSNLTEAFIPPSFVASLYVPESWNTSRSTAGAFVLTMFASNAALSAVLASGVSTVDAATAAPTLEVNTARGGSVVANRPAANSSTSRREGSTGESAGLVEEEVDDEAERVVR